MIKLKKYQEKSLATLKGYLNIARFEGAKNAYDKVQIERFRGEAYKPFQPLEGLNDIPYMCLRLPTGGGKTLLSAHTIAIAGKTYLEAEYPLTLWLVPSTAIKNQTIETLKKTDHPNYQTLDKAFDGKFRVFDSEDFRQIRPQDIRDKACVIVSTFAALRVDKTEGRKAYAHDENLESHFAKIPHNIEGMEVDEASGQVKFSFVNLLHYHRPLVIVDEAHNAKSDLSVEVLNRINASCVIEYTATPATNSNIIHSVTAAELKAEEMIKLPILLMDHISWGEAITEAVRTRQGLEEIAHKDKDYIRPIILFQAENKDKEVTPDVLKNHLLENENIPLSHIAVVTGNDKELDNINLYDPNCEIRYVITVQALKEGWDCPFAYVFCSVANIKSKTAIEQLLGRVLRMPYAKRRAIEDLNRAYAHVSSKNWGHAVTQLTDHLVAMGFERQEAEQFAYTQQPLSGMSTDQQAKPFSVTLTERPDLSKLDQAAQSSVTLRETSDSRFELTMQTATISQAFKASLLPTISNKKDRLECEARMDRVIKTKKENQSPAERGEIFSIPQLCLRFGDEIELAETELCLDENGWNILDYYKPLTKDDFAVEQTAQHYLIDMQGTKIEQRQIDGAQLSFDGILTDMTDLDLCRWLDCKLYALDIKQEQLLEFLRRTVRDLLAREDLNMPKLLQGKFLLEKLLAQKIRDYRKAAYKTGFQSSMFGKGANATISFKDHSMTFDPHNYPTSDYYDGKIGFEKHYYRSIANMNKEEAACAQAIDRNPLVKFWVRNLERNTRHAFWLPTATDNFYPDFVAQLNDGRLLVIEYKGAHLDGEDTQEKELIGKKWAELSGNLFLMAWKKDKNGRDVYAQINGALG